MSRARKHIDTLTAERDEFKKKLECEPCSKKVLELESEVSRLTLALSDPDLKTRRLFLAKITAEQDELKKKLKSECCFKNRWLCSQHEYPEDK